MSISYSYSYISVDIDNILVRHRPRRGASLKGVIFFVPFVYLEYIYRVNSDLYIGLTQISIDLGTSLY